MKKISNFIYIHKSAIDQLTENHMEVYKAIEKFEPKDFTYDVIKCDCKLKSITYISSHDWDTSHEPTVGDAIRVDIISGSVKKIKSKGQIYHHKWMFVDSDYKGFDVEKSKARSVLWQSVIPNTREIKTRIGYRKFWDSLLDEYNIEK